MAWLWILAIWVHEHLLLDVQLMMQCDIRPSRPYLLYTGQTRLIFRHRWKKNHSCSPLYIDLAKFNKFSYFNFKLNFWRETYKLTFFVINFEKFIFFVTNDLFLIEKKVRNFKYCLCIQISPPPLHPKLSETPNPYSPAY